MAGRQEQASSGGNQSIQRAIAVLEMCSQQPRSAVDIAEHLQVHRSTVTRILQVLSDAALIQRTPTGRYAPGLRLVALGQSALENYDLGADLHPFIVQLSERTGQTVQFAQMVADSITYVDKIEPPAAIRLDTRIGAPVVEQTAGVAKAILAYAPRDKVERRLETWDWQRYTDSTIMTPEKYLERLDEAREKGWTYDDGEYEELSNCIAAPIRDHTGTVIGAVSITTIRTKMPLTVLESHLPELLDTTEAMSLHLGWKPSS